MKCAFGGEFGTALNTELFLQVWQSVINDARFQFNDWTVKADPDCVFFPQRLHVTLAFHPTHTTGSTSTTASTACMALSRCFLRQQSSVGPVATKSVRSISTSCALGHVCGERTCSWTSAYGRCSRSDASLTTFSSARTIATPRIGGSARTATWPSIRSRPTGSSKHAWRLHPSAPCHYSSES